MFSKSIKTVLICSVAMTLSACSNLSGTGGGQSIEVKEKFYESTKNYSALISLYRDSLKRNEDPAMRYKLAESYYQSNDSKSSLLYLKPLLVRNDSFKEKALLLQVKNNIQLGDYSQAMTNANALLSYAPSNGEAYNLRGIVWAQQGKLQDAYNDINRARELFITDLVAINNLAMLSIINGDYHNASELLLPQYLNGSRDSRVVHNLVFALVKRGDIEYALDIIRKEKLNTSPEDLVNALRKTERLPQVSQ